MTDTYTSERLARALGWTKEVLIFKTTPIIDWYDPGGDYISKLPDWEHDLNAIAKVEAGLDKRQRDKYVYKINDIIRENVGGYYGDGKVTVFDVVTAPAPVRLRALIDTLESGK